MSAPQPWDNIKSIRKLYFSFSSLGKIVSCGEKNIFPNLTNSQEPEPVRAGCFWLLGARAGAGAGAAWKKTGAGAGAGAAWEKNQEPEREPEPLEKKSGAGAGAGAAWKKSQEPEPEPIKNLPAPQPRFFQ